MAFQNRQYNSYELIHHSDRGSQYCCKEYISTLNSTNIATSMTEKGNPYENALVERVNSIIKNEFNLYSSSLSFDDTRELIERSIEAYNNIRPHSSCDYLTPLQTHQQEALPNKRWKKYPRKRSMYSENETAGPGVAHTKQAPWPGK